MKRYTLDRKLLTDTPEIEVGDRIYKVDNRVSTVKRLQEIEQDDTDRIFAVALGQEAADEIAALDMPFPALLELTVLTVAAMTGEDTEDVRARFRGSGI